MSRDYPGRIVLELQPDVPADVAIEVIEDILVEWGKVTVYRGWLGDQDGFGHLVKYPDTETQ
jgi:hypothetical protein